MLPCWGVASGGIFPEAPLNPPFFISNHGKEPQLFPLMSKGANQVINDPEGTGQAAPKGRRSYLDSPWHFCSRCGSRIPLKDLEWQNGLLLCNSNWFDCLDTEVQGERDARIREAVEAPTQEMQPDPKLTNPDILDNLEDFIS